MKKFNHYNSGGNRAQYKWSSAQNSSTNSVHKVYTAHTTMSSHVKLINQHQNYSAAPLNGLTSQHHKLNHPTRHLYSYAKFGAGSRPNKYVFVSNSTDKETMAKPTVSKLPIQPTSSAIQSKKIPTVPVHPTSSPLQSKKITGSRNDVFRFTSVPKPVSNKASSLVTKSSDMVQEYHKKTNQPKSINAIATGRPNIMHQQKLNKRKKQSIVPSRSQLKWTSNDNINTNKLPAVTNSKPRIPYSPLASNRPSLKQLPSTTRSRFTWRRSSSETPRRRSSSNLSNHVVSTRYKMQIKSSPVICKKVIHRRTSLSSGRKIVYIGGVAYNATARRLSRRLSSGSSKRKLLAKSVVKKAGNRVWVAKCSTGEAADESLAHPGYEIRRKKGNRQWIAGNKSILARQANSIKHKYAACKSQLTSHPGKDKAKFLKVFIKNDIFIMDSSKRKLRRLSRTSLGSDSRRKIIGSVPTRTPTHQLASNAVRRSKALVWHAAKKKKNVPKSEQYCMFYNRFGKCSRRDTCPYIHDPDKIAVCTRFLRGTCDKTDGTCPFSHQITKEKMPVCSYFLRGVCTKDDCPYLHVYVGENAEICHDFIKGFCPNGDKCDKKHLLDCPDFSVSGKCSKGDKCPLRHRKRIHKRRSSSTKAESKEPKAFKRRRIVNQPVTNNQKDNSNRNTTDTLITPDQLEFIPLEQGPSTPPDFIAL